jgi:hypothetical protein
MRQKLKLTSEDGVCGIKKKLKEVVMTSMHGSGGVCLA